MKWAFSECEKLIVNLVKEVAQKFPTDFSNLRGTLAAEHVTKLDLCLNTVNGHTMNGTS